MSNDKMLSAYRSVFDIVANMIDRELITEDRFPDDFLALHRAVTQVLILDPAASASSGEEN